MAAAVGYKVHPKVLPKKGEDRGEDRAIKQRKSKELESFKDFKANAVAAVVGSKVNPKVLPKKGEDRGEDRAIIETILQSRNRRREAKRKGARKSRNTIMVQVKTRKWIYA